MKQVKNMALGMVSQHGRYCVEIVEERELGYPFRPDSFMAAVLENRRRKLGTVPVKSVQVWDT